MTAVTDEFPYYLRPKKAVFSGLICVAMYLMGLVLTTDVSGFAGWVAGGEAGEASAAVSVARLSTPRATRFFLFGRNLARPVPSPPTGSFAYDPESWLWSLKDLGFLQLLYDTRTSGFPSLSLLSHQ